MLRVGKRALFIALLVSVTLTQAAPAKKLNPTKIHRQISLEKRKLSKIKKKIAKFEKKLERSNKEVIAIGGQKSQLEKELYDLRKSVALSLEMLLKEKSEIKSLIATYVVNMMGETEGAPELLTKKILIKRLKKDLSYYDQQIADTEKVQKKLKGVQSHLQKYHDQEKVLLGLIAQLEEQKRLQAQNYIDTKTTYENYLAQWQKVKVSKTRTSKTGELRSKLGTFLPPLEKHTKLDFKKKGVTFYFSQKTLPVLAPRARKVIHNGSLAPYGNVIMIDHGKETISVCFGDFGPKVKKGMRVKSGQVIGYTSKNQLAEGKLYFEVRKKDKAQPTIHLLDDKALASTGSYTTKS